MNLSIAGRPSMNLNRMLHAGTCRHRDSVSHDRGGSSSEAPSFESRMKESYAKVWIAPCQVTAEGFGVFRSSNSNRRNVLKSFKIRRLAVMCDESLSNL